MKYVLDASIGLKTVLPEDDSPLAVALIMEYLNGIHELIAPDTLPIEVAHAVTRAGRRGIIEPSDGPGKIADFMANSPALHPYIPLLAKAVEISIQARIGVFDCLYVALAEQEQCKVVTADKRMLTLFAAQTISLDAL